MSASALYEILFSDREPTFLVGTFDEVRKLVDTFYPHNRVVEIRGFSAPLATEVTQ